jgi:O-antigen/teichoic acid export membrane protein
MSVFKAVVHTLSSRLLSAILNFVLLWFTARWMGAEVRGEISLYFSSIYLLVLVSGFAGGSTLIYLAPRFALKQLLLLSYVWCAGVSLLMVPALAWWPGLPSPSLTWWIVSSLLFNLTAVNRYLIIGLDRIKTDNLLALCQNSLLLAFLVWLVLGMNEKQLDSFVWAFVGAWGSTWLLSLLIVIKAPKPQVKESAWIPLIKTSFGMGLLAQSTNLAQFIAYRIQYYLLAAQAGKEAVGVFSTAVSLAEAVWMITQSISIVQLSKIVQKNDRQEAAQWSLPWFKISLLLSFVALLVLLILPSSLFAFVFGPAFGTLSPLLYALSPGILALAGSNILTHYFAGTAQLRINLGASLLSLISVTALSMLLLSNFGILGAAWASSLAYLTSAAWLIYHFNKQFPVSLRNWLPGGQELNLLVNYLRSYMKKKQ